MASTNPIEQFLDAVKAGPGLVGRVIELTKNLQDAKLFAALAQMNAQWAETQAKAFEIQQELQRSQTRIANLEAALRQKEDLEFDKVEQAYRLKSDPSIEAGRFCANCVARGNGPIRLLAKASQSETWLAGCQRVWQCPNCKNISRRAKDLQIDKDFEKGSAMAAIGELESTDYY